MNLALECAQTTTLERRTWMTVAVSCTEMYRSGHVYANNRLI